MHFQKITFGFKEFSLFSKKSVVTIMLLFPFLFQNFVTIFFLIFSCGKYLGVFSVANLSNIWQPKIRQKTPKNFTLIKIKKYIIYIEILTTTTTLLLLLLGVGGYFFVQNRQKSKLSKIKNCQKKIKFIEISQNFLDVLNMLFWRHFWHKICCFFAL